MAARILFVDDDAVTRVALVELLTRAGYKVSGVGSLPEAREALSIFQPDLLITDIRLDGDNGLELVVTGDPPMRAIVITGYPDPVLAAEARAHGAAVLLKPVDPAALFGTIEEVLKQPTPAPTPTRRWVRKRLTQPWLADVNGATARIVDVSYGGVRLELQELPTATVLRSLTMAVADLTVPIDLVWHDPTADRHWTCGLAVVPEDPQLASRWCELVDAAM